MDPNAQILQSQFGVEPEQEMLQRRQEADKAAYVAALLGKPLPAPTDFATTYAAEVTPLERNTREILAAPGGIKAWDNMLGGLLDLGLWRRHQGVYPPARFPDHYDFTKK